MVGVTPHTVWSRPLPTGDGWEARAEARTLDGRVVGSAEAMCSAQERTWARKEDQEIRSMAQTRAMSKALAGAAAVHRHPLRAERDAGRGGQRGGLRAAGDVEGDREPRDAPPASSTTARRRHAAGAAGPARG